MELYLVLFVIGLVTGTLSGLFGVGGGFVVVPLLTLIGIPIQEAIGLSLVYIIGTAISGLIRHFKQGTVDITLALVLSASSVITAQFGARLAIGLSSSTLKLFFGLLTAAVAIFYVWQPTTRKAEPEASITADAKPNWYTIPRRKTVAGQLYNYRLNWPVGLISGAVVGFISGMFGVGGGFLLVPLMQALIGVPLKIAIGTSLLCVIAPALSSSFALWQSDKLDLHLLPALLAGGLIGAQVGARLVMRLKNSNLKVAFSLLLFIVSIYMLALGTGLI